jgi:hypothetical protein
LQFNEKNKIQEEKVVAVKAVWQQTTDSDEIGNYAYLLSPREGSLIKTLVGLRYTRC